MRSETTDSFFTDDDKYTPADIVLEHPDEKNGVDPTTYNYTIGLHMFLENLTNKCFSSTKLKARNCCQ